MAKSGPKWVDETQWSNRWNKIQSLVGGGQGDAFRATRISDQHVGFLKTIKSKNDPERRARFFREASAYNTFRVDGIPTLIESNAHLHDDTRYAPYIVTEFIEGPTLRIWRDTQDKVSLEVAITVTHRILNILDECHAAGCVHRDVKPENVILEADDPARAYLLDFGLNYHDLPDVDFRTEDGQEIGNRFLRLTELSAGSPLKQDPRSDLSFAAGILFYLVTGENPGVLQDADGKLPHQRPRPLTLLQNVAEFRFARLASFFDNSFAPLLADRFSSVRVMRDSLREVMADKPRGTSPEDDLTEILQLLNTSANRRRAKTVETIDTAIRKVWDVFGEVERSLTGALTMVQTGYDVDGEVGRNTLYWTRPGSSEQVMSTSYEVRETGDELVVRLSGEPVFRTSLSAPNYGGAFRDTVRSWVLARIRSVISDPNSIPPEADIFAEVKPLVSLRDAAAEASSCNRPILAFVYDPAEHQRGRLQYGLSNFLRNRRTRDIINSGFVTALIPLSQLAAVSSLLDDMSMEDSRWVVFDSNLRPLEQDVIYANAQEGERIMAELATRHRVT